MSVNEIAVRCISSLCYFFPFLEEKYKGIIEKIIHELIDVLKAFLAENDLTSFLINCISNVLNGLLVFSLLIIGSNS